MQSTATHSCWRLKFTRSVQNTKDREKFETTVRNGRNQMPPWKGVLGDEQIETLWQYIRANAAQK